MSTKKDYDWKDNVTFEIDVVFGVRGYHEKCETRDVLTVWIDGKLVDHERMKVLRPFFQALVERVESDPPELYDARNDYDAEREEALVRRANGEAPRC